jgi:predicted unusual protein kinase regulating ubiquinone biosynthesis (AarF/ABC1/UbiB family)
MKFGQALSVFEAAIPDEYAAPFRESLIKLQTAAPPMPSSDVHRMLTEQFGRGWRARFTEFDETPAAAASIGQVHRGVWHDGRTVAVKVQYPGAGEALRSDLRQLSRMSRVLQPLVPGLEIKPLLAELRDRMEEELDYRDEAANQRAFAAAFADDDKVCVPKVVASAPKAMVTEWVTGRKLSDVIRTGTQAERDDAAALLAELHYSSPPRAGLLHADPHPGNFRILSDGRLGVVDFGAVARLPDGSPEPLGLMTRLALEGRTGELMTSMRNYGFIRPGIEVDPQRVLDYLRPILDPLAVDEFTFTREWMRAQAARMGDPRSEEARVGRMFNLPPSYLLIHRVTLGSLAVLCQLGATAPFRALAEQWQPGFAEPVG